MSHPDAFETALTALRYRDLSARDLDRRLATRGYAKPDRDEALATLSRTGLLDDRRFAENRAASLAARGAGDRLIRDALDRAGVDPDLVEEAVHALEPEAERARALVERRGPGPKTARYLSGKGYSEDTVREVFARVANGSGDELG